MCIPNCPYCTFFWKNEQLKKDNKEIPVQSGVKVELLCKWFSMNYSLGMFPVQNFWDSKIYRTLLKAIQKTSNSPCGSDNLFSASTQKPVYQESIRSSSRKQYQRIITKIYSRVLLLSHIAPYFISGSGEVAGSRYYLLKKSPKIFDNLLTINNSRAIIMPV